MISRYLSAIDPGGASGVVCGYGITTNITGSASFEQEQENIFGQAGAIVTVQVTQYTVSNSAGQVLVDSAAVVLNDIFTVPLDGTGNGNFIARVQGNPANTGTVVRAVFTIISVSSGQLTGGTLFKQISKVF